MKSLRQLPPVQTTRTRRSRTSGGFTLVELIAVMTIVAILAITATPAIHSVGQSRNKAAAQQLLRDLTFARQHAQATGTRSWVAFDVPAQAWTVLSDDPDDPGFANALPITDAASGRAMTRQLGEGHFAGVALVSVNFSKGDSAVGFDWLGRSLQVDGEVRSNSGTVSLTGGHTIMVEGRTGYALIE